MSFTLGIIFLVGGSIFLVSTYEGWQEVLHTFERESRQIAAMLSGDTANALYRLDVRALRQHLEQARVNPNITHIYVTDVEGVVLADGTRENAQGHQRLTDTFSLDVLQTDDWISRLEDGLLKVGGPTRLADGSRIGHLLVGFALKGVYHSVYERVRTSLYLTIVCLGIGATMAIIFATNLSRPIAAIVRASQQIGAGKLETRVLLKRHDELGRLADAMNQMAENLSDKTVSKRFVDNIIQSMADMLIVLNVDWTIRLANDTAVSILGYAHDELIGKPFRDICREAGCSGRTATAAGQETGRAGSVEKTYSARDGRAIPVSFSCSSLYGDDGTVQGSVCIAQDITERKRAEEALRENEAWLRLLTKQMPAVLWTTDTDLRLTASLGTGLACVNLPWHPEKGQRLVEVLQDSTDEAVIVAHRRALSGEAVTQEVQYKGRTFHAQIEPLRDAADGLIGTIGVALDITERRRQEQERQKITYEIHDGIAQLLVSAQQHLDTFEALWQRNETLAQPQLEKGLDRLNRAIVEARRLMAQLHMALETQDLILAVRRYLEELGRRAGWEVEFVEDVDRLVLPPDKEAAIFRIIREALTNAWKHASTPKIYVEFKVDGGPDRTLSILIRDWGRGFQPEGIPPGAQGLGLLGMHERAQRLGGACIIESLPGQGTTVRTRVPLNRES
jgi:PAS domain S-box-containing protein